MRSGIIGAVAWFAAAAISCSTVPAEHPWAVRPFVLQPKDEDFAGGLALEHAYAADRSVALSFEGFTREGMGDRGPWRSQEAGYLALRLEHRSWSNPGERIEPYWGAGLAMVDVEGEAPWLTETEWTVFGTAGVAWWWTPAVALDLGLLYDVPVSSDDQGVAPDWLQLRLGLAFWF